MSLEVSPLLAFDTAGTLDEARRLWRAVAPRNLMIKVPATRRDSASAQLISEGINVNVTLLFAQRGVRAGGGGVHLRAGAIVASGGDPARVASVASFFVSRIDSAIDAIITARLPAKRRARKSKRSCARWREGGDRERQAGLPALPGDLRRPPLAVAAAGGRSRNACCGPARARRTPSIPTSSM